MEAAACLASLSSPHRPTQLGRRVRPAGGAMLSHVHAELHFQEWPWKNVVRLPALDRWPIELAWPLQEALWRKA